MLIYIYYTLTQTRTQTHAQITNKYTGRKIDIFIKWKYQY